tara:strand:- start:5 stop:874 length:870 start_codon:yes stop_codon:yes gene_type:complete
MSRSRDTADQINRLNSSAANATAITIDSSENVLVGKAVADTTTLGNTVYAGIVSATMSNDPAIFANRAQDGSIIELQQSGSTVGSIGTNSSRLTIGSGDTGLLIAGDLDNITPFNVSTNASRDAAVDLGNSGVRFKDLYLSGGVYLGGTGAANYLSDYEEGTFTPVISDANTGGNLSPTVFTGGYTKIGNLVYVNLTMFNINTTGMTAGNTLYVQGLPFTSNAGFSAQGSCTLDRINFTGFVTPHMSPAKVYLFFNDMIDSALEALLTVAAVTVSSGSDITVSMTYRAT